MRPAPAPDPGLVVPKPGPVQGSGLLMLPDDIRANDLRRRVSYLMLFRLGLISLVLGATLWLTRLGATDPWSPNSIAILGIIIATYVLTIAYAVVLRTRFDPGRLATVQLVVDMVTTAVLVHLTGGAQSAYTFFFPLSIIAASAIHFRMGAVLAAAVSMAVFCLVSVAGWLAFVPTLAGQPLDPTTVEPVAFGRALALNTAAFVGVAALAYNLGGQIQQTSQSLEKQRTRVADLQVLHLDIVRSLSTALITVATDNVVLTANRVACELLNRPILDIVDKPLAASSPELASLLDELAERQSLTRESVEVDVDGLGQRVLGVTVSPLRNNRDQVVGRIIHCQDLTEVQRMERAVRMAERLATVGQLAAGVAHEIRNPLAAISGSIQLLGADPSADDDTRALTEIVEREVERLNALITDLLDYASPQRHESVTFDMREIVAETLAVFARDPQRGALDTQTHDAAGETPLWVSANPSRIKQVLWNLLRNAAQAAESKLQVRTALVHEPDEVRVEVMDDGPGIAPEHLPHIFDPFFTTKEKGTGLGLATCHSIIAEHQGRIEVANRPSGGARFSIFLPLAPAP